jgi:hypothetical protein
MHWNIYKNDTRVDSLDNATGLPILSRNPASESTQQEPHDHFHVCIVLSRVMWSNGYQWAETEKNGAQ